MIRRVGMFDATVRAALLIAAIGVAVAMRAEAASRPEPAIERDNPLADLPSQPGPHVEKIRALGDNSWLDLGPPAPDPAWGTEGMARGRSWGGRALCAAPELRGAFFCGTGVHGFVKSDGRYMDDLWFYDINAHRWICLYPGADTKTLKLKLGEHNFEYNEQGDFIPVSYLSHAYGNTTYNPDLRKFTVIWCTCYWWKKAIPQRNDWLEVAPTDRDNAYRSGKLNGSNKDPVFWDVATGRWERRFVEGEGPDGWNGLAEYVPSMKKTFYCEKDSGQSWLYDCEENTWTALTSSGRAPKSHNGCLDPGRGRVYSLDGEQFAYFDLKTNAWVEVRGKGQPVDFGDSNTGRLTCDTASGRLVWHYNVMAEKVGFNIGDIFVYDPDTDAWERPKRTAPKVAHRVSRIHGCYDPELNVHFYYLAGDSKNDKVTMMVYRYRRAPAATPSRGDSL